MDSQDEVRATDITDLITEAKMKQLKKKYNVGRWVTYNFNPELGIIGGWILDSKRGIQDAYSLIIKYKFTVYIHRSGKSALLGWNIRFNYFCGQLWKEKNMLENFTTTREEDVKIYLKKWWLDSAK